MGKTSAIAYARRGFVVAVILAVVLLAVPAPPVAQGRGGVIGWKKIRTLLLSLREHAQCSYWRRVGSATGRFRRHHPDVTRSDIRKAARIVVRAARSWNARQAGLGTSLARCYLKGLRKAL